MKTLSGSLAAWFERPRVLAAALALCVLPAGLGCALLTPLGAPPDELAHIARADGLRLGQIGNPPSPIAFPGVVVNEGIFDVILAMEIAPYASRGNMPPAVLAETRAVRWSRREFFCVTQMVVYFPLFYLPAALGLAAGKLAGLSPLHAIILARLAMLASYIAMGAVALRLAKAGGPLLLAGLTLPTALCLAASCSQDGQLIAAAALAAALLSRARPDQNRAWWAALGLLTAIALAKFSYLPLLLFCLMPLRAPGLWRRAALVALAALAPGLWLLHVEHIGFAPWPYAAYHPGPLWPGSKTIWLHDARPAQNALVLRAHPLAALWLPWHSLIAQWGETWRRILACVSVDRVLMPAWEFPCLALALGAAASARPAAAPAWRAVDAAFGLLLLLGMVMVIELSLYLTYTEAGATEIAGVQGRYFLLLLPFAGLVLARARPPVPPGLAVLPALAMAAVNAVALPLFVAEFFRMALP